MNDDEMSNRINGSSVLSVFMVFVFVFVFVFCGVFVFILSASVAVLRLSSVCPPSVLRLSSVCPLTVLRLSSVCPLTVLLPKMISDLYPVVGLFSLTAQSSLDLLSLFH